MFNDFQAASNEKPEPSGIGGWLILPAINLVFTILRSIVDLMHQFQSHSNSHASTNPSISTLVFWELVVNTLMLAITIRLAMLFFNKTKQVPKFFILWMLANLLIQLGDIFFASVIVPTYVTRPDEYKLILQLVATLAIWGPYFLISKRVKNTFVH